MNRRIPPGIFLVILAAACLIAGTPLYRLATDPLYHGGVPETPAEARGRPAFPYRMPARAMPVGATRIAPFADVAAAAGLRYEWTIPGGRPLNILQTIGNGCAFLDYDNDGNLDILLVGPKVALYRGDGHGHFTDVTRETGLDRLSGHFLGCAVGDYDNDGFPDIYISGYRTGVLLHNESGRRFTDVTAQAGIAPQPWGTSAAFAETVPGTGRLDLYVCNYVDFDPTAGPQLCRQAGVLTACPPTAYRPLKGVLYNSDGHGHFTDSTQARGADTVSGKGLGVAFADYDGSGRPSLAIANDEMPGDLLRPTGAGAGQGLYTNVGVSSGTAYDRDGSLHNGMGIDWGDYDNDGKPDLFVTTFFNQTKSLYHNEGSGVFSDRAIGTRLHVATLPYVAFGCKWLDYDNDGWLDLMIANGHVYDNVAEFDGMRRYRQPTQLFHNAGAANQGFEDVSASSPDLMRPIVGRGLAVGDYDNDGRVDVLIVDSEGRPLLLHNETGKREQEAGDPSSSPNHWLGIRLIGVRSNRDGCGALLTASIGGRTLTRLCHADGSYLSSSDPRVHFGLGSANKVDRLTVRWPSGRRDTFLNLGADHYVTIREGDPRR
jgi:hypothetical protein